MICFDANLPTLSKNSERSNEQELIIKFKLYVDKLFSLLTLKCKFNFYNPKKLKYKFSPFEHSEH